MAIEAQLAELQRRQEALDTEQGRQVNNTAARVRARHVAAALSRDEAPRAPLARASQNVAAATALLETLPEPSSGEVGRVYDRLKKILNIAAIQQAESSLQRRAEITVSSPGHSMGARQKTAPGWTDPRCTSA